MNYLLALIFLFAILFVVFLGVRITIRTARYREWCRFAEPAVGIVGELKNVTCNYDKHGKITTYCYHYALNIVCHDQEFDNIYTEECESGTSPVTRPGNTINILWSERDQKYLQYAKSNDEIKKVIKQEVMESVGFALHTISKRRRW